MKSLIRHRQAPVHRAVISKMAMFVLLAGLSLAGFAQTEKWTPKTGAYLNPTHIFSDRGEIQIGLERAYKPSLIGKIGLGFRFKGTTDPDYLPYKHVDYLGSYKFSCEEDYIWILLFPVKFSSTCDNFQETQLTEKSEDYVKNNVYLTGGMKFLPNLGTDYPDPIFFELGLVAGHRSYFHYIFREGLTYTNKVLVSEDWEGLSTRYLVYNYDKNSYDEVTKEVKHRILFNPYVSYGIRLNLAKRLNFEVSGTVFYADKATDLNNRKFRLSLNAQVGVWIF